MQKLHLSLLGKAPCDIFVNVRTQNGHYNLSKSYIEFRLSFVVDNVYN